MRKILAIATALAVAAFLVPGVAFADQQADGLQRVVVTVDANVSVGAGFSQSPGNTSGGGNLASTATVVAPGTFQTGGIWVDVPWRVDANTQVVDLQTYATYLFKADDPFSTHMIPIDVPAGVDVVIHANEETGVGGNPTVGSDLNMAYTGETVDATDELGPGWIWYCTEIQRYQSGERGTFSHDLWLSYHWFNADGELPKGEYSGWVKLLVWTVMD